MKEKEVLDMDIKAMCANGPLIFDGAMGTMIQMKGIGENIVPEQYNISHPEEIESIHRAYVEAGSQVITANTFGANPIKLSKAGLSVEQVIRAGIACAKRAAGTRAKVALCVGPTGKLMAPFGDLTFEAAYEIFADQVRIGQEAGADLILIETMSDLYEAKAAVLAAKQETKLPVICTMTFEKSGKTLMGTDPESLITVLEGLGVDGLGLNCSLGPAQALAIVEDFVKVSQLPILLQPNAGLPKAGGEGYDTGPEEFAKIGLRLAELGVEMLGGCCGTTPDYIRALRTQLAGVTSKKRQVAGETVVASSRKTVVFDKFVAIGQNINPSGRKDLTEAIISGDIDRLYNEAELQVAAGADILDINLATGRVEEHGILRQVIEYIQSMLYTPLQIDSADPSVLELGARIYNGKPILNSVNGSESTMEQVFPIAKKYGACLIALTIDDHGVADTAEKRYEIASRIVREAEAYGIEKRNIIVDCVVQSLAYSPKAYTEALRAVSMVKDLGVKTCLGIGNLSFGLRDRENIDAVFLAMAMGYGLDSAIMKVTAKQSNMVLNTFKYLQETSRMLSF